MLKRQPASTNAQKIAFLLKHEQEIRSAAEADYDALLRRLGKEMQAEGLYFESTVTSDMVINNRMRIRKLGWRK